MINRCDSQVQSTGATHKCDQQVQLTSVIKNAIESRVRSLQVCKVQKFTSSKVCTKNTKKTKKLFRMNQYSLTMNAQQLTNAPGLIEP